MREQDWTQQSIDRVKDIAALRGRERMREALRQSGIRAAVRGNGAVEAVRQAREQD